MQAFPWEVSSGQPVRLVRAKGIDATFLVANTKLKPLFDLF
jgi:hypothetical protein